LAEERRESGEEGAVKDDYSHIPHGRERERERERERKKLKQEIMGRERERERESSSCERILYLPF